MNSKRKHNVSPQSSSREKIICKWELEENENRREGRSDDFFSDITFYILKAGIEKARMDIFRNQILQNGGKLESEYSPASNISHIVVDDKMEETRFLKLMKLTNFPSVVVVKSQWLSLCLKNKELIEPYAYQLKSEIISPQKECIISNEGQCHAKAEDLKSNDLSPPNENPSASGTQSIKASIHLPSIHQRLESDDSDYEPSDDELKADRINSDSDSSSASPRKNIPVDKWICAQSSKNPMPNCNKHITDKLEEMVKAYNSTNDKWRSFGYQKCIRVLMRHPKAISSWEEAKSLPGVGGRLADKIWEIAQSGELRKLNEFKSSEEIKTLELFNNVWGAGPHTAQSWYQQGFRSIDDLRMKAKLTSQQKVGVRLYEELLERMPREEAGKIAEVVRGAAEKIQNGLIAQACGSYRRGKLTCGDVDVLVTHPDGKSHKGVFRKLLDALHDSGFLTDDLVSAEENGNQKKYLGVCKLPGENTKHRRLDIIVVPYHEYACALLYFTGSAHFNRSLRLLCKRQDMSLSEHALRCGVIRQGGERVHEGTIIPTPTEESVFNILKIPYRPPEERDH